MLETHPVIGPEDSGLVTPHKPRLAVPNLPEAQTARKTSNMGVDHQLLGKSAGGDTLPDHPLLEDPLPDDPLPAARPDGSVGDL